MTKKASLLLTALLLAAPVACDTSVSNPGPVEDKFLDMSIYVTIKYDLVPNGRFYMFADPKFLGKFFVYTDTTMYVKREAFLLSYFAYETIGSTIANPFAIAAYDFQV